MVNPILLKSGPPHSLLNRLHNCITTMDTLMNPWLSASTVQAQKRLYRDYKTIISGGTIAFEMGSKSIKEWGIDRLEAK